MNIKLARHTLISLVTLAMGLSLGSALQIALAWTGPTSAPPDSNVAPPLNISATDQTKSGSITVSGGADYLQAPQFRDNDNTTYYLDPNLDSKLHYATFDNVNSLGAVNANRVVASSYAQAPLFYDNDNTAYYLDPNGLSMVSAIYADNRIHTPILYDTNDGNYYVDPAGASQFSTLYANAWFRAQGNSGLYFESYGGGWYMSDPTWIRAFNDKNIYSGGDICTNAGGWKCLSGATMGAVVPEHGLYGTCFQYDVGGWMNCDDWFSISPAYCSWAWNGRFCACYGGYTLVSAGGGFTCLKN